MSMAIHDKPLILCIEDEEDVREIIGYQLKEDFKVIFAKDGKEGVRQAIFLRPDLILMDIMMPNIDGIKAANMIKSVKALSSRPLVGLTAAPKEIRERALKAGCDFVLQKPALDLSSQLHEIMAGLEAGGSS